MLERILRALRPKSGAPPALPLDAELLSLLERIAAEEGRAVEEVVGELLWKAVADRSTAVEYIQPWEELTPRERETAALACLGYTNSEIADLMVISTNTVKTHIRHVLRKFDVSSKRELREVLTGWDFAEWLEEQNLWQNMTSYNAGRLSSPGISP